MRDIIKKNSVKETEKTAQTRKSRKNDSKKSAGGLKRNYLIQN